MSENIDIDGEGDDEVVLDTPDPPDNLPYAAVEDYRARALLTANKISLAEEALIGALQHREAILKGAAAHVLGSMGSTAAIPALEQLCATADDLVKVEAAYALVRCGVDEYRAVLKEALSFPINAYLGPPVAAGDLARLGDPSGFPVIEQGLMHDNLIARVVACKQLLFFEPFHGTLVGDQLIDVYALFGRALHDQHSDVQWIALLQIRELNTAEARSLIEAYQPIAPEGSLQELAQQIRAGRGAELSGGGAPQEAEG